MLHAWDKSNACVMEQATIEYESAPDVTSSVEAEARATYGAVDSWFSG